VRAVVREPRVDEERRLFCYALTEDRWVVGGPINNGGVAFQWARDALFPGLKKEAEEQDRDPYDLMSELAAGVPAGSEGLVFLPYLMGERAPHWNANVRGVFFGLTMRHGREHLIRAVLEGVMFQLREVARTLEAVVGEPDEVRATGGFVRSGLWRAIMADVFGREVVFPESHESSCWGAALLAMRALGELESLDAAHDMTRIAGRQEPDAENAAVYEGLGGVFARLYGRLEPEFAALAKLQRPPR
jgi:gluconokinase